LQACISLPAMTDVPCVTTHIAVVRYITIVFSKSC